MRTAQKKVVLFVMAFSPLAALSDSTRLINDQDTYPNPSPDGSMLVFQSNRTGTGQIFETRIEGGRTGTLVQLTNFELGAETPVFTPDGDHIVFSAYVGEQNNDVHILDRRSGAVRQLTETPGYDGHPHVTSDGERIVFNSDRTSPDPDASWSDRWHEIFSMRPDGSDVTQHTRCEAVCTYGSISPSGQRALYRKVVLADGFNWGLQQIERNSEIFVANLDGSDEINISNNAAFDGWPVWSPDGSRIAFASNRSGPANTGQIWTMNPDGTELLQVSFGPWSHVQPAWSNDGKSLFAYQHLESVDHEFGTIVQIALGEPEP